MRRTKKTQAFDPLAQVQYRDTDPSVKPQLDPSVKPQLEHSTSGTRWNHAESKVTNNALDRGAEDLPAGRGDPHRSSRPDPARAAREKLQTAAWLVGDGGKTQRRLETRVWTPVRKNQAATDDQSGPRCGENCWRTKKKTPSRSSRRGDLSSRTDSASKENT
jgi:hypothetical protein